MSAVSSPRISKNTPVSAFQLPAEARESQREVTLPRPKIDNGRVYTIVIIGLLMCMVAVLAVLLLVL